MPNHNRTNRVRKGKTTKKTPERLRGRPMLTDDAVKKRERRRAPPIPPRGRRPGDTPPRPRRLPARHPMRQNEEQSGRGGRNGGGRGGGGRGGGRGARGGRTMR